MKEDKQIADLSFRLETSKQKGMVAFQYETTDPGDIWNAIKGSLQHFGFGNTWSLMSKPYSADRISTVIKSRRKPYFNVKNDLGQITHGPIRSSKFDKLDFWSKLTLTPDEWDSFFTPLFRHPGFLNATVSDYEYQFWQNAEDLMQYKLRDRDHRHLPKVIRDAPRPLNTEIVDTSRNPGRMIFRQGNVEEIGGVMWLTPKFFDVTNGDRAALEQLKYLQVEEAGGIVRVLLDKNFLADAEGDEAMAKKQDEIRAILFPSGAAHGFN